MDINFWHQRWENNQIGFHEVQPNQLLVTHFHVLRLSVKSRIFLPLCGKTSAIQWMLCEGHQIVGVELSEIAIQQLFEELNLAPTINTIGTLKQYSAENIDIFVGNLFDLTSEILGHVDAVFDRASLVALPYETRVQYTSHLVEITQNAPQLLIVFTYDQTKMEGPPFSISADEIQQHYAQSYQSSLLEIIDSTVRGNSNITESIWYLMPNNFEM